jgi:hypothetical protein
MPDDPDWIDKLITTTGPMAIVFGLVIWFAKSYFQKTLNSHLDLMDVLKTSQQTISVNTVALKEHSAEIAANQDKLTERLIVNQEKLTESVLNQQQNSGHCKTTSSALLGLCDVIETGVKNHPNEPQVLAAMKPVRTILTTGK